MVFSRRPRSPTWVGGCCAACTCCPCWWSIVCSSVWSLAGSASPTTISTWVLSSPGSYSLFKVGMAGVDLRCQDTFVNLFACSFTSAPGQIGFGMELDESNMPKLTHYGGAVWHTLLLVLIVYAMLPLPLLWCTFCAVLTSLIDLVLGILFLYTHRTDFVRMVSLQSC